MAVLQYGNQVIEFEFLALTAYTCPESDMFAKKLHSAFGLLIQPARYIRGRRPRISVLGASSEAKTESVIIGPDAKRPTRNPRDLLEKDKVSDDTEAAKTTRFRVSDLKPPEEKKSEEEEKLLGRDVAERIRSDKRARAGTGPEKQSYDYFHVPNMSRLGHVELSKVLRKQVIYADENLVILNKPYGIVAHDGDGVETSLRSCLPVLSKMIYGLNTTKPLLLCNRLDKGTTGITVCATNKDLAYEIMTLFRQQKIRRKYWAVTIGCPSPSQGVIDIPMSMRRVDARKKGISHSKMMLNPEQKVEYSSGELINVKPRKVENAATHYKTLDSHDGLALIELQPFTTIKHQLRVHTSEGLGCPILGDHKYSRPDDLAPQSLPKKVLHGFRMKRTRTRDIPMHLHLREMIIPGILDNPQEPNLLISAKFSPHLRSTTKLFKLKPGPETDFKYPTRLKSRPSSKPLPPHLEELYTDPFAEKLDSQNDEVQRDDCYGVYKPKVKVKFKNYS